jgi:hypothetical protein
METLAARPYSFEPDPPRRRAPSRGRSALAGIGLMPMRLERCLRLWHTLRTPRVAGDPEAAAPAAAEGGINTSPPEASRISQAIQNRVKSLPATAGANSKKLDTG